MDTNPYTSPPVRPKSRKASVWMVLGGMSLTVCVGAALMLFSVATGVVSLGLMSIGMLLLFGFTPRDLFFGGPQLANERELRDRLARELGRPTEEEVENMTPEERAARAAKKADFDAAAAQFLMGGPLRSTNTPGEPPRAAAN